MTTQTHSQAGASARSREALIVPKKLPSEVRRRINKLAHANALIFELAERTRLLAAIAELPSVADWAAGMPTKAEADAVWAEAFPNVLTAEEFFKALER